MKKILSLTMLLTVVTAFTACSNDDPTYTAPEKLTVKSADAFYEPAGGTGTIVVSTTEAITATTDADWLTATVSGQTVTLTVGANEKLEGRSANVLLKSAKAAAQVNITQKGVIYGVSLGQLQLADSANSVIAIPMANNFAVTVESLTDWLTATFDEANSEIIVTGAENNDVNQRVGYIALSTGVVKDTLAVVQRGMKFELEKSAVLSTNAGDTLSVALKATKAVTLRSSADWFSADYDEEAGTINVIVKANTGSPRVDTLLIASGQSVIPLAVRQYDFEKETFGDYVFVYFDSQTFAPVMLDASLSADGLLLQYPATETITLPYLVPAKADATTGDVTLGPNGSYLGTYGQYYIYLRFASYVSGLPVADFSDSCQVKGILSFEQEEAEGGSVEDVTYMDFTGSFGSNDIDLWLLGACTEQSFTEETYAGVLKYLISPYMIKLPAEQPVASEARKQLVAKKLAAMKGKLRKQTGLNVLRTPWKK